MPVIIGGAGFVGSNPVHCCVVRVVTGLAFDVAVDMRKSLPAFGRPAGVELSADNRCMLWAPPGFARGFLVALASRARVWR